jgi:hypothetical protein
MVLGGSGHDATDLPIVSGFDCHRDSSTGSPLYSSYLDRIRKMFLRFCCGFGGVDELVRPFGDALVARDKARSADRHAMTIVRKHFDHSGSHGGCPMCARPGSSPTDAASGRRDDQAISETRRAARRSPMLIAPRPSTVPRAGATSWSPHTRGSTPAPGVRSASQRYRPSAVKLGDVASTARTNFPSIDRSFIASRVLVGAADGGTTRATLLR